MHIGLAQRNPTKCAMCRVTLSLTRPTMINRTLPMERYEHQTLPV